jgi:hypothetical protein
MPPQPSAFIGRNLDLFTVLNRLLPPSSLTKNQTVENGGDRLINIYGEFGSGKSTFCKALLTYLFKRPNYRFADGLVYIDIPENIQETKERIAMDDDQAWFNFAAKQLSVVLLKHLGLPPEVKFRDVLSMIHTWKGLLFLFSPQFFFSV